MSPTMERVQADGVDPEVAVDGAGETVVFIHGAGLADSYVPVNPDFSCRT